MRNAAVLALALLSPLAHAACTCVCVGGQVRAICQSALDLRPICAPQICPITPPSIAPIPSPIVPPIGTTNCHPAQVWNGFQYVWRTVCS